MDWALGKGYPNPVKQLSGSVVEATIKIYDTIAAGLLPTPMKSHYTFNLRDMAKVFQGLTQGTPKEICDKGVFVSLWCHEAMRVFHDRLINDHDRDWFVEKLGETCKDTFFPRLPIQGLREESAVDVRFLFGLPADAREAGV